MYNQDDFKYLNIPMPQEVNLYKFAGDFEKEIEVIDKWLKKDIPFCMKKRLELERVFAEGLNKEYNLRFNDILNAIKESYPNATEETVETIISFGNVDFIMKNGERAFEDQAISNIFGQHGGYLEKTLGSGVAPDGIDTFRHEVMDKMKENGSCAYRFTVEESIKVTKEAFKPGKKLRVWLPYPCENDTQSEIKLISSSHPVTISNAKQRTCYMEAIPKEDETFTVKFSFVNRAKYNNPDPSKVTKPKKNMDEFLCEQAPHIEFSPLIKSLAKEIAGDETNPLILAKKIYTWISTHVKYSYMRPYVYMDQIPEFVILNGYGDCGTIVLVFVTLCRALGIPAKWQSGSSVRPGYIGSHDWAMFYVEPYGWMHCDPCYGVTGDKGQFDHYFCNLDPLRLVANDGFQTEFDPKPNFLREDPYDNQSGEAEYFDENLFLYDIETSRRVVESEEIK